MKPKFTANEIEILLSERLQYRRNLVVPNVPVVRHSSEDER